MRYGLGVPSFAEHTYGYYILYVLSRLTGFANRINYPPQLLRLLFLSKFLLLRFIFVFFVLFWCLKFDRLCFGLGFIQNAAVNLEGFFRLA